MDPVTTVWFGFFAIILFLVVSDENVAEYVSLNIELLFVNVKRYYYMLILHPRNPITNWIMERKMKKLADELCKEMQIGDYAPKTDKELDDEFNYDTNGK